MAEPGKIVMIVEDDNLLLRAISKKFENTGIETSECTSAEQALDYLRNYVNLPSVIWLDYHLKDMDGLQFMTELKKDPKLASIPVVVVSNSASEEKVSGMLALGAKKYLLKAEYRLEDLVNTFKEILNQKF